MGGRDRPADEGREWGDGPGGGARVRVGQREAGAVGAGERVEAGEAEGGVKGGAEEG